MTDPFLNQAFDLHSVLGIACDPWGSDDNFDVYFSVSRGFWVKDEGGEDDTTFMPYLGAVVKLNSADDFATMEWVITGLPVSGFDHLVNGLEFLHDRRLLIAVGGQTNAGWPSIKYGGMFDSPLTAAILAADVTRPDFDGTITYGLLPDTPDDHPYFLEFSGAGKPLPTTERVASNQRWGDWAFQDSGDVYVYASGIRNPFDV